MLWRNGGKSFKLNGGFSNRRHSPSDRLISGCNGRRIRRSLAVAGAGMFRYRQGENGITPLRSDPAAGGTLMPFSPCPSLHVPARGAYGFSARKAPSFEEVLSLIKFVQNCSCTGANGSLVWSIVSLEYDWKRPVESSERSAIAGAAGRRPVDILSGQVGDVGLRSAAFPEQFVKQPALRTTLGLNQKPVFLKGDCPPLLIAQFRPRIFDENRPGQPAKVQGQIVEPAEVIVGRRSACMENAKQIFARGFKQHFVADGIESLAGACTARAILR